MKFSRQALYLLFVFEFMTSVPTSSIAFAQTGAAQTVGSSILGSAAAAFSGKQVVQRTEISGDATWYAGSLEDSGSIHLSASADGSFEMQLDLGQTHQKTESRTVSGSIASCHWSGSDGVSHNVDFRNCAQPLIWFLPSMSLQPSFLPDDWKITDLGYGLVGSKTNVCHHLRAQVVPSDLPSDLSSTIAQRSVVEIGLDPSSLLPVTLTYSLNPDRGSGTGVSIEVQYSDYRVVNGVQIPFAIRRYVNGSLQLEIKVISAQVN